MGRKFLAWLKHAYAFVRHVLDPRRLETLEESTATWVDRTVHFWMHVVSSFIRNRCPSRATALAYTTLLALVPMLAICLSLATSMFKAKYSEEQISDYIDKLVAYVAPQLDLVEAEASGTTNATAGAPALTPQEKEKQAAAQREREARLSGRKAVARNISQAIGNIRSGALSVSGALALIVVAIMLLSTIEGAFNDIWGVEKGRNWFARVVHYWAAITLGPIALFALGLLAGEKLQATTSLLSHLPVVKNFIFGILPFIIISLSFAFLYKLMPNTAVMWRAAMLGGLVGGCLWLFNNVVQAKFVSRVVNASAIYGPLASLPIFLAGLYVSWVILLFGAQVAYAWQNRQVYWQERRAQLVNQRGREFVAVRLLAAVARRFVAQEPPATLLELADEIEVPSQLVSRVLQPLLGARLVARAMAEEQEAYLPGRPLQKISLYHVLDALRSAGGVELETRADAAREVLRAALDQVRKAEAQVAGAVTFEELMSKLERATAS